MNWLLQVFDPANVGVLLTQFQADLQKPAFWLAVGKIIWINVLLSGDNALVIAMACRGLQPRQRLWGMVIGAGIAVILLIVFTGIVATLMALPYLKLVGGIALSIIAAKLLVPEDEGDDVTAGTTLWHAVRIVVIADIVMSLDNVIAVAAAANGELALLVLGLAISIPMIIAGAALIMMVLDRFPVLVWLGALLLGWIAGDVIESDPAVDPLVQRLLDGGLAPKLDAISAVVGVPPHDLVGYLASILGAIVVFVAGSIWRRRKLRHNAHAAVLTPHDRSGAAEQSCKLLEAAADPIGDQIDHPVLEHQHQFTAAAAEMRGRQDAWARRRDQMGDAKGRAKHARALVHRRRHQSANGRRWLVLFAQTGIAIEHRQRDKGPALMTDRAEIAVHDETEGLFAAVIGMNAPSDVG